MYKVYIGRDNEFAVQLVKNGVKLTASEMQAITNVGIVYEGTEYKYSDYNDAFDWSTREDEGVLICKLGGIFNTEGRDTKSELILYTATDVNGVVWDYLDIKIIAVS